MPVVSSIFLIIALALAAMIGAQLRSWTWGPAMIALGLALIPALGSIWRNRRSSADLGLITIGIITAGWFALRASVSPVAELGRSDMLLLASAVGAFFCAREITRHPTAARIMIWGIALILLASLVVAGIQLQQPEFSPVFPTRIVQWPSGFFSHYNEGANFVIGTSLLVAGAAIFGRHTMPTRIFFGLLALAGFAEVYFSRSKGGILGVMVGWGCFAIMAVLTSKQRKPSWFAPSLIALPLIGIALMSLLFMGWDDARDIRSGGKATGELLDNDIRLYLAGIAISCIGLHPWTGGGSQSYSWECYQFWERSIQGIGGAKPELVHNEFLQAASDYGIIGAAALLILFSTVVIVAVVRIVFPPSSADRFSSAWCVGGLSGLAGLFTQSNFSFVFHLVPLAMLLGICLGCAAQGSVYQSAGDARALVSKSLMTVAVLLCVLVLVPFGVKGTKVTAILWPSMFSKNPSTSPDARINALTEAINVWPQSDLFQLRAATYQEIAGHSGNDWAKTTEIENVISDYAAAAALHPYNPTITINQANLLSSLNRDAPAEEAYSKTLLLQGGMENGFFGHFHLADHLLRKGLRQYGSGQQSDAVGTLELAAAQIEKSVAILPWHGKQLRVAIHESLGTAREGADDFQGALETYDFTCTIPGGHTAHYRAGVLLGRMAVKMWADRRPSEALGLFIEAKKRATTSGNIPVDVSGVQRVEYLAYLDRTIAFLKGAKVEPVKPATPKR